MVDLMSPERWQQIEQLYHSTLERSPADRADYLRSACGSDDELRHEVESLVAVGNRIGSFMESSIKERGLATETEHSMVGITLGRYRLDSLLGRGGMGEVYLGQDTTLRRKVAIKVLPQKFTLDAERLRRLIQEARAASALNHPNIITIYEFGQLDQTHYLVTEYIEGETLRTLVERGPLNPGTVLNIASQVASSLAAAHAAGITHRDIKPENLILRPDGLVKVLDFGLAKLAEPGQASEAPVSDAQMTAFAQLKTTPGIVLGTISYMSPEQLRGESVDHRSDIFSFGVTLYELITGQRPFAAPTASDLIAEILRSDVVPAKQLKPELPVELDQTISRMLAKESGLRQSASELLLDLQAIARNSAEGKPAKDESTKDLRVESASLRSSDKGGTTRTEGTRLTLPYTWMFLAAALIAVVAGVYFFSNRSLSSNRQIHSLVVLPFINGNSDPSAEYLGDGITESLINSLSQLPQLKVTARTTSFRYKGRDNDAATIVRDLKVDAIVVGKVTQQGGILTVQADLLDTADGTELWGNRYSSKVADIFSVQEQIAGEIAQGLRLRLTNEEKSELSKRYTNNINAYQDYLQGQKAVQLRTQDGILTAKNYFEKAIQEDSNYALAYAGLTDTYIQLASHFYIAPVEGRQRAKEAVDKALSLDPNLAEAHIGAGELYFYFPPYDFATAQRECSRAIELSPSLAFAHNFLGQTLMQQGHRDEAFKEILRARELDPLAPSILRNVANWYYLNREYPAAFEALNKSFDLGPPFALATEVSIYLRTGSAEDAERLLQKQKAARSEDLFLVYCEGMIDAAAGKRSEALSIINQLEKQSGPELRYASWITRIAAALNEKELTLSWLERGLDAQVIVVFFKDDSLWDPIRNDPRFTNLLKRMGFLT